MEILDPFLKQVVQWAVLAGPFAILILAFLWGKEVRDHKNTKTLCAAKIDQLDTQGKVDRERLQTALDAQRDARLADTMKMLPIIDSNNSINLANTAAMENRNRAQETLSQVLKEAIIKLEHLEEAIGRIAP